MPICRISAIRNTKKFLEEDWLFEAMTETYIPLLDAYDRLVNEKIPFRITMSVTPPLAEMLADPLLQSRYEKKLEKYCDLANKELVRTKAKAHQEFYDAAKMHHDIMHRSLYVFRDMYKRNIVQGFKRFQDEGVLEVITCGAHTRLSTFDENQKRPAGSNPDSP